MSSFWSLTLATLVSHVSLFLVLLLALRFCGVGADQTLINAILRGVKDS